MKQLYELQANDRFKVKGYRACVTNPEPTMLYYAAGGQMCKFCIRNKNYTIIHVVRYTTYCYFTKCGPRTSPQ
jgi:hypothetical protein